MNETDAVLHKTWNRNKDPPLFHIGGRNAHAIHTQFGIGAQGPIHVCNAFKCLSKWHGGGIGTNFIRLCHTV